jgi:hypothetical protein
MGEEPKAATPESLWDATKQGEAPPVVSVLFGGYTSNGTWAAGIGHTNKFRRDTIRYAGFVAFTSVISDFYVHEFPIGFDLEGTLVYQDLKFRMGKSRFLVGTSLSYFDATNVFDFGLGADVPPEFRTSDLRQIGIAAKLDYDSRDNTTMPSRGQLVELGCRRTVQRLQGSENLGRPGHRPRSRGLGMVYPGEPPVVIFVRGMPDQLQQSAFS